MEWAELQHAYGSAKNMPQLLEQLSEFPREDSFEQEPWFSIWSSLYHQGDIYSASFAAVPEIVSYLANLPEKATFSFFALPASIEVARFKNGIMVPSLVKSSYLSALTQLGELAAQRLGFEKSSAVARAAIAAFLASVKQHRYAELVLEIAPEEIPEVLAWHEER